MVQYPVMEQNLCVVTEGIEAKVKECCEIITRLCKFCG